jgi:NADPH2:quinone reductase
LILTKYSGIILDLGENALKAGFHKGDHVFGADTNSLGAFAEQLLTSFHSIHRVPFGWSFIDASGLYLTWPTCYAALVHKANVQPGEWCLVHAASGGIGSVSVKIAKALGAKVIAAVGSDEKFKIIQNDADHVINYTTDKSWYKSVLKFTKGKGVNVVLDCVGLLDLSLKCLAWSGRLVIIGFTGGKIEKIAANKLLLKNASLHGLFWGSYRQFEPNTYENIWDLIFSLISNSKIKPLLYPQIFQDLESIPDALTAITSRMTYGKVVVSLLKDSRL